MTIPLKTWIIGAISIFVFSLLADFFFIHYLFSNKKEAQIEKYNEGVVEFLNKKCDPPAALPPGSEADSQKDKDLRSTCP
jgi:hypothetical protein